MLIKELGAPRPSSCVVRHQLEVDQGDGTPREEKIQWYSREKARSVASICQQILRFKYGHILSWQKICDGRSKKITTTTTTTKQNDWAQNNLRPQQPIVSSLVRMHNGTPRNTYLTSLRRHFCQLRRHGQGSLPVQATLSLCAVYGICNELTYQCVCIRIRIEAKVLSFLAKSSRFTNVKTSYQNCPSIRHFQFVP